MLKYIVVLSLSLFATTAYADFRCDNKGSKAKVESCYRQQVKDKKEALEEYHDDLMSSPNVPSDVKAKVDVEYKNFMNNIYSFCPNIECVSLAMSEHIRDMYTQTRKWTVPQSR